MHLRATSHEPGDQVGKRRRRDCRSARFPLRWGSCGRVPALRVLQTVAMALRPQTIALLQAARQLVYRLPADAVLLLTATDLDWEAVLGELEGCRLLVAAEDRKLTHRLKARRDLTVLDIDPGPTPTQERMSLA